MSERLLALLLQQAALLSVGVVLMGVLRRLMLKRLGPGSVYAAWLLLPTLLTTPLLPRPTQEPLHVVMRVSGTAAVATAAKLPAPPADQSTRWLALWLAGAAGVAAMQARRQWRLARFGDRLPAGISPALVGLLRARIALPTDFEQRFAAQERMLILAHEQVHRDRLDNVWNLLACVLTALHWWNPLAWWAARRMQADQELACDAVVLARHPNSRATYTRALLAAHGLMPPNAPLASRWSNSHPLVERIAMLNSPLPLTRRRAMATTVLLAGAAGLTYAAQMPQIAAPTNERYIRLTLMLVVQEGNHVRRSSMVWVGKSGERMRVALDKQTKAPGINVELTPTGFDDKGYRLDVATAGLSSALKVGPRSVTPPWDQPQLLESIDETGTHRFTLFVIGTRTVAPTEGPKPQS